MSILQQICDKKQLHVDQKKGSTSLSLLHNKIENAPLPRGFKRAISNLSTKGHWALIAEIKKASPSGGIIRVDFCPETIAQQYQNAGATCLSVLTDEPYFQGHDDFLRQARDAVALPALRKDFIVDEYQIFESRALGADCILLIMAALSDEQAKQFLDCAKTLDLDVLVEVHDDDELERAIAIGADMIGINNRNLKTLEVTLSTSLRMAEMMPENVIKVAESGIRTNEDILSLIEAGFQAFLVGESLMRQPNIDDAVHKLMGTA